MKEAEKRFNSLKQKYITEGEKEAQKIKDIAIENAKKISKQLEKQMSDIKKEIADHEAKLNTMQLSHNEKLLLMQKERDKAEQEHKKRLLQQELDSKNRLSKLERDHFETIRKREDDFNIACNEREKRLELLSREEKLISQQVHEMLLNAPDDANFSITLSVSGQCFKILWRCIVKFERSVFFEALRKHQKFWESKQPSPEKSILIINGNPRHFELIAEYLRDPSQLPIFKRHVTTPMSLNVKEHGIIWLNLYECVKMHISALNVWMSCNF